MGDELKSAYELAVEKLARRGDGEAAGAEVQLTDDQKRAIAEIRQEFQAKLAEREIIHHSQRQAAAGNLEALERLDLDYRRERERLESRREARIREVREGDKL